jgi:glutamine synthetase
MNSKIELFQLCMMALIAFFFCALSIMAYDRLVMKDRIKTLRIGVVDINGIVRKKEAEFAKMVTDKTVTDKQRDDAISMAQTFSKQLSEALVTIPVECNCVLLSRATMVGKHADVIDYTDVVMQRVGMKQ